MAFLVTVFVVWKTFHKNLLDVYYSSVFLFVIIYIYNIYIHNIYVIYIIYIYYIIIYIISIYVYIYI